MNFYISWYVLIMNTNKKSSQRDTELDLIKRAQINEQAREELFYKYEKMIYKIVQKYKSTNLEYEDLLSEAIIGFYIALSKFDETKNIRFSTYSTYWIKERVLALIKSNNRKISIAYNKLNLIQKIKHIEKELNESELSQLEKDDYICQKLSLSKEKYLDLKNLMQPIISIDNSTVLEIDTLSTEDEYSTIYVKQSLLASLAELNNEERYVIIQLYYKDKSLKEIKQVSLSLIHI